MVKNKVNYKNITLDTNVNKDGELYNKLYVNFNEGDKPYRLGEFLSFAEKVFLKEKYNLDFETVKVEDITQHIQYVEICKDENKYGVKQFMNVHFDIGYDKKINLENDDFFLVNLCYKLTANNTQVTPPSQSIKKQI